MTFDTASMKRAHPSDSSAPKHPVDDALFTEVYNAWHRQVRRWALALGAPPRDAEDATQDVFIIVRRRLSGFQSGNFRGWLFRITQRTVRDLRQRAWFRHALLRGTDADLEELPQTSDAGATDYQSRETLAQVHSLLARMSRKRRETFVLFEIEGYSGEEIAARERIPLSTVWTRLHYARKELKLLLLAKRDARRIVGTR